MAEPLIQAMPPNLDIGDGYVIRFAAVDPTTGAAVSGVVVSSVSILAADVAAAAAALDVAGPFMLVPGAGAG